jgi:hypothetical protein
MSDMLRARRRGFFKRVYEIFSGEEQVTELSGVRREGCVFALAGTEYRVERVDRRHFRLVGPDGKVATAERQTGREWMVQTSTGNLKLVKPSMWRSGWEVRQRGATKGQIRHEGVFSRTYSAGVPDDVPLPVAVFTLYVALVIFERDAAAAAAASSS